MLNIQENVSINNGYNVLIETLTSWGVKLYTGITGGGIIHFIKYFEPLELNKIESQSFFSLHEYSAGFVPLGYYLSSGNIACSVATSGAATKLLFCGLSDAKLHDIPAIYVIPLPSRESENSCPLQDMSVNGSHIYEQLKAECPNGVFVFDDISLLTRQLSEARQQLNNAKPVIFLLRHEVLIQPVTLIDEQHQNKTDSRKEITETVNAFIHNFKQEVVDKRVVLMLGEELIHYPDIEKKISLFSQKIGAAVIWSINGANAATRDNPYGYGYLLFGGNCAAIDLYRSLGQDDILVVFGACPDEYTTNLKKYTAAKTFYLSYIHAAYGQIDNSFEHRAQGDYEHIHAPLDELIDALLFKVETETLANRTAQYAPENLNFSPFMKPRYGYVDLVELYQKLDTWWPKGSIGIDDVCMSYKDRQYITQKPNSNIRFFSLYRGSAMGNAFGTAIGARLANPESPVFMFTGDGCFRFFAGSLCEARDLGLTVFLLNNGSLGIVQQGASQLLPHLTEKQFHTKIEDLDYCMSAKAAGWLAEKLLPDLSNLDAILQDRTAVSKRSMLIEVPVDVLQILGKNPRVQNL